MGLDQFEEFVRAHIQCVRRFVALRLRGSDGDDVVSEVFVAAWRRWQREPDAEIDRAWLLGVAVNQCRMAARSERTWRERLARRAWQVERSIELEDEVVDRLDAAARGHELLEAFASLSSVEQEVLGMSAWVGLEPSEIARVLSMSPGTVRSHLHRARTALINHTAKEASPR